MIGRRELLGIGVASTMLLTPSWAQACTVRARVIPKPFRRRECEQQIHELVAFMNEAPALSADAVIDWVDARDIEVDSDYPVSKNVGGVLYTYLFFQEFRLSGGKLDPEPIRIKEINLIRTVDNQAAFEFTVVRKQFFPADDEGCNGLFVHPEYYEQTETAFIARFHNNRLEGFRDFPEWFA